MLAKIKGREKYDYSCGKVHIVRINIKKSGSRYPWSEKEEMAKAFALFSVPTPHETHLYKRNLVSRNKWEVISCPSIKFNAPLCSPSSTTVVEDDPSPPADDNSLDIPQRCQLCSFIPSWEIKFSF